MPSPRRPGLHAAALRPARPGWDVPARASRRPHEDPAARLRPVSVDPRESSTCLKAGGDDELRPRRPASVCSRTPGASPGPGAGPARGCAPAGSAPGPRGQGTAPLTEADGHVLPAGRAGARTQTPRAAAVHAAETASITERNLHRPQYSLPTRSGWLVNWLVVARVARSTVLGATSPAQRSTALSPPPGDVLAAGWCSVLR